MKGVFIQSLRKISSLICISGKLAFHCPEPFIGMDGFIWTASNQNVIVCHWNALDVKSLSI